MSKSASTNIINLFDWKREKFKEEIVNTLNKARGYKILYKLDLAIRYYKEALNYDPTNRESLLGLASVYYYDLVDDLAALNYYEQLLRFYPEDNNAAYMIGRIHLARKDWKRATAALSLAKLHGNLQAAKLLGEI